MRWLARPAIGLAAALTLDACAPPPAAPGPAPSIDLAARLPEAAAGFRRGAVLPLAQRRDGQEVAYASRSRPGAGALVELYRAEAAPLAEEAGSGAAAAALDELLEEARRAPGHRQQRETARLTLPAGERPGLACAETTGQYGRESVDGLLCAGIVGGRILRLRVTTARREPPPADLQAFATAILASLRGP